MADAEVKQEFIPNQEQPAEQAAQEAAASASEVSDETIKEHLHKLLAEADLQTTTEKNLRKQLEEQLGCDLTERKALIRKEVEDWLNSQPVEEEVQQEKKKKRGGFGSVASVLSPALSAFLGGVDRLPRPQVVSKIWEYIKANNLQDPTNKRNIICDDKMKTIFTPPINMFNMNKQLSKHCKRAEDVNEGMEHDEDGEQQEVDKPKRKAPAKKKKIKQESEDDGDDVDDDSDGGKPKKKRAKRQGGGGGGGAGTGFNKPVKLSPQLAQFLGADELSRGELTKRFWAYYKANNLMDPADKRFVLADERLKELLGEDRFQAFSIQKLLAPHIIKNE